MKQKFLQEIKEQEQYTINLETIIYKMLHGIMLSKPEIKIVDKIK